MNEESKTTKHLKKIIYTHFLKQIFDFFFLISTYVLAK